MSIVIEYSDEDIMLNVSKVGIKYDVGYSAIHGTGLFACMPIWQQHVIGYYEGDRYPDMKSLPDKGQGEKTYYWVLTTGELIDGKNDLRFANHSCNPNAESREVVVDGKIQIVIYAIKNIMPGDEITINYRLRKDKRDRKKYECLCRASNCRGTMLDVNYTRRKKKCF